MLDKTLLKCKKLDLYLLYSIRRNWCKKGGSRSIFPRQATRSLVICFNINMVACSHFPGRLSRPGACVLYGRLSTQATGRLWFVSVACYVNLHGHLQSRWIFALCILGGRKFYLVSPLWSLCTTKSLCGSSLCRPILMMLRIPETRQLTSHPGEKEFRCVALPSH